MTELIGRVRQLVEQAERIYDSTPAATELAAIRNRLAEPLRVAVAGRVKAGKSTLLNALVGEQLAPTDAGECTKIVTWYRHGPTYRVTLELRDGSRRQARFHRNAGAIEVDLGGVPAAEIDRMVIEWPTSRLADMTLIDTPGIESISTDVSARTMTFLAPGDERATDADAVVYLMRHLHATDLSFLESFHDAEVAKANPINAIGVLSRADEIGVGRTDAMRSAKRIAERYRLDPKLRALCQTVLPVAGLLAETATTLTEDEFRALETLANQPRNETDELMLSADRFIADHATGKLTPLERRHLLDRFGIFGIRVALPLIRLGRCARARDLADTLIGRSGVDALRSELLERFGARRDILQGRSALLALDAVVGAATGPEARELSREIERVAAGEHAFAEIRLMNDHRRGLIPFPSGDHEMVERLLGVHGRSPAAMAGLAPDAPPDDVRASLVEAVEHWRRRQESPLSTRELSEAARILVRTCEGALERLDGRTQPAMPLRGSKMTYQTGSGALT